MWLLLLSIHVLGLTGFNLLVRKSVLENIDKFTVATIMQTGIAIPALFLVILYPPTFSQYQPQHYIGLALEVILAIGLQVSNVKALQYLEASVYPVFYNLRILITTVLGILFLSEDVVWSRILGGVMILLAIIIVKQKSSKHFRMKGIEWGIAAALVISLLNTNEKIMIENVGLLNFFPMAVLIAAVIMWGYLLFKKDNVITPSFMLKPRMLQLMTLRAVSAYSFPMALAAGALVSVANYVSAMSVILMVILGVLLLKEKEYIFRKITATTIAVAGLTIVLFSSL